jgi:quinol monooxygenase YgiN
MNRTVRFLLASIGLSLGLVQPAHAAEHAYVVTYIEVAPSAKDQAADSIRRLARLSRKDAGNIRFEVLQRIGHPGQFAILEMWEDKNAQEAHGAAAHTQLFREKLKPMQRAPYDERPHTALSVGSAPAGDGAKPGKGLIFAVTHVDIVPKLKDEGVGAVKQLSDAGRKGKDNLRFESLTQTSRPNHMTVVEVWRNQKAVDLHGTADHTRQFREKLLPMSGSRYDERFYRVID